MKSFTKCGKHLPSILLSIFAMFPANFKMLFFVKVKCMVFACFFVNVDLCECEILVLDNLIKKEELTLLVLPDPQRL